MKKNFQSTRRLTILAALAAISAVFQLLHVGFKTQWGMWIDVVSVPWIMAYFLFDLNSGLIVSLVGSIIITLIAPDTWLGASAKLIATLPMILGLYLISKNKVSNYKEFKKIILPIVLAILVRGFLMFFFNYYFALPIWIPGKTPIQLMNMIPWYIIIGINAIQGVIDVVFAWILVFPYKLSRFGQKNIRI